MLSAEARNWLAQRTNIAPHELICEPMRGANSSSLFLLHDSSSRRFVLRLFDQRAWLLEEPDLVAHEAAALIEARRTGLNTPELVEVCEDAALFGAPAVLMSHLSGRVELCPHDLHQWIVALANSLANLHQHIAPEFAWEFVSWTDGANLKVPDWANRTEVWERAIALWQNGAPAHRSVFIHRDFHPANVLWQNETVSGVVDWVNACRGPAWSDVGHCQTNLALLFGASAAEEFLRAYETLAENVEPWHPFWQVDTIFDMVLPQPEFYAPWREFGVPEIPLPLMQQRVEEHLFNVLRRSDLAS